MPGMRRLFPDTGTATLLFHSLPRGGQSEKDTGTDAEIKAQALRFGLKKRPVFKASVP